MSKFFTISAFQRGCHTRNWDSKIRFEKSILQFKLWKELFFFFYVRGRCHNSTDESKESLPMRVSQVWNARSATRPQVSNRFCTVLCVPVHSGSSIKGTMIIRECALMCFLVKTIWCRSTLKQSVGSLTQCCKTVNTTCQRLEAWEKLIGLAHRKASPELSLFLLRDVNCHGSRLEG